MSYTKEVKSYGHLGAETKVIHRSRGIPWRQVFSISLVYDDINDDNDDAAIRVDKV